MTNEQAIDVLIKMIGEKVIMGWKNFLAEASEKEAVRMAIAALKNNADTINRAIREVRYLQDGVEETDEYYEGYDAALAEVMDALLRIKMEVERDE